MNDGFPAAIISPYKSGEEWYQHICTTKKKQGRPTGEKKKAFTDAPQNQLQP
jgi:hypothetical protein